MNQKKQNSYLTLGQAGQFFRPCQNRGQGLMVHLPVRSSFGGIDRASLGFAVCDHLDRRKKAVATLGQRLDKARTRRGVSQHLTELIDDRI